MLGERRFKEVADAVLRRSKADETEIVLLAGDSALTRFANSEIHQNVVERNAKVRIRMALGRRVGVASANDLGDESLARAVDRAEAIARRQPERPDFPGLPAPSPTTRVDGFRSSTADCPPGQRASSVKQVCDLAHERGLIASGALSTDQNEVGVASSRGVRAYHLGTRAHLVTVVMDDAGSGYAERTSLDVDAIDAEAAGHEAVERALRSRGAIRLEPGEYPVVLEEYAVGEVLSYLAYMGFGAQAYQEGYSFMRDKLGNRIVDARISIWDDGADPAGLPMSFDFEGLPRQRVELISAGVARGVVYDSQTAARDAVASTGHALPPPNTFGPFPMHLFMAAGETPKAELARGIDRGIWVTRFHYVNVVKPDQAVLTGMTRDGTFLIERGEVTRPIKNLRFTQSILEAWDAVGAVSRERALIRGWGGANLAPAMRLDRFTFTGVGDVEAS